MGILGQIFQHTVGYGLSVILNLIDRILATIFIVLSPAPTRPKVFGVPVTEKKKGETRVYRNPIAVNEFLKTPREGCTTVSELFETSVKMHKNRPCMGKRDLIQVHTKKMNVDGEKKTWETFEFGQLYYRTYEEIGKRVSNFANGVAHFTGLEKGARVGIYERTRPKWMIGAQGCWKNAYTVCTVYDNLGEDALIYSINLCEMTTIICNGDKIERLVKISKKIPSLKYIIYMDKTKGFNLKAHHRDNRETIKILSFKSVEDLGKSKNVKKMKKSTKEDTAVIMFTSGSTGNPKGVVITHENVAAMCASFDYYLGGVKKGDVLVGYLPLAHIFEMVMELCEISLGGAIGYGGPRTLINAEPCGDLAAVRPTIMGAVPRVYDTIKKVIGERMAYGSSITKWIFKEAYAAKLRAIKAGRDTPFWNFIIFRKFRSSLGGRVKNLISGGAPLSPDSQEFFRVCFGSIVQGYGLTETTAASTIQHALSQDKKNIGGPIACCEIKLKDVKDMGYTSLDTPNPRGEVLVRGLNVSKGYYKNEKKTKEAYAKDGWFSTGDIGELHSNGSISIIDRKKNLVKMAHGEYVAIENMEMIYSNCPFVSPNGICIYGDSYKNDIVGVIIPQRSYCLKWAKQNGFGNLSYGKLLKDEKFIKMVLNALIDQAKAKKKKKFEYLKAITLYNEEWTPENMLLTAAMKLKRQNIIKKYKDDIDSMYKRLGK